MVFLLILLYPVIEIYTLVKVGSHIGFVNTVFALVASGVLGAGLARTQGRYILGRMQASLARGEVPTSQLLQSLLVFIAGILFLIPGFVSDAIALVFVLPGTRHLMAAWMRRKIEKQLKTGGFRVFSTGSFGGPFGAGPFGGGNAQRGPDGFSTGEEDEGPIGRDVTPKVIDVTPLRRDSRPKSDDERDNV